MKMRAENGKREKKEISLKININQIKLWHTNSL